MNNQMNNRLTVNDEGVQRMTDNNSAMYYSNQMIIAQTKQEGWRLKRNPDGTPIALGRGSILAYVKAIADMYSKQKALGLNIHDPSRAPLARTFLDTFKKEKVKNHLGCRDKFCFLISHANHCRSQTALGMQFADLFSLVLESQGIPEYVSHLVLNDRNCFEEITYQKQYKTYKGVLNTAGIHFFKVTHINRGTVLT
ncbi:hypothetical protein BCV71DRAFT_272567 [Rhizopus microsporus]|uniref:Ndc10 domain-containing protein n=1 Tax=Rhizopus microsporus TaxID=58291 RepID=A0A1X0RVP3_RHIZD|nr:hypothetical protein BCV71DRAFT_272567 [Rhizopus microsporus]